MDATPTLRVPGSGFWAPGSGLRAPAALEEVVLLASLSPSVQEGEKPLVPRCCETSSPSLEVLTASLPVSTVHGPGEDGEQLSPWGAPEAWEPAG